MGIRIAGEGKKVHEFNKKDNWSGNYFYRIYEKDGEKYIRFYGRTDRKFLDKKYMSWITYIYGINGITGKLADLCEWDFHYGMAKLLEHTEKPYFDVDDEGNLVVNNRGWSEHEPEDALDYANTQLLRMFSDSKDDGLNETEATFLPPVLVDEDTPCGCYYG